jgi:predicted amidophosphoribosyltransferase
MNAEISLLKLDAIALERHVDLDSDDICHYWREYTSGTSYDHSETNQLIRNFQISVLESHRKHHKELAIQQLSKEFIHVIPKESTYELCTFVPIPPSKPCEHPEYDNRLIKLLEEVGRLKNIQVDIRPLIIQTTETKPSKANEQRLSINALLQIYELNQKLLSPIPKGIIVFDDVLTKGTHFKAAKKLLQDTYSNIPVIGLFIAQAVYSEY